MMKAVLASGLCAVLLAGCSHPMMHAEQRVHVGGGELRAPPNCTVNVYVNDNGRVVIDNEPVYARDCDKTKFAITWRVQTPTYVFRDGGIRFDKGGPSPECKRQVGGIEYVCYFVVGEPRPKNPLVLRYSIHLHGSAGDKDADPSVIMD
jgi:hypothetical protein